MKSKRFGKVLASGLAILASMLPGCSTPISSTKPKISGYAQSTLQSEYISGSGSRLSEGPVVQNFAAVNFGDVFQKKDNISAWVWDNHDLTAKEGPIGEKPNEIDFGLTYSFPLSKKFSARFGPAIFIYPEDFLVLTQMYAYPQEFIILLK